MKKETAANRRQSFLLRSGVHLKPYAGRSVRGTGQENPAELKYNEIFAISVFMVDLFDFMVYYIICIDKT